MGKLRVGKAKTVQVGHKLIILDGINPLRYVDLSKNRLRVYKKPRLGKITPLVLLFLPLTLTILAPFWSIALRKNYWQMVREINSDLRGDFDS